MPFNVGFSLDSLIPQSTQTNGFTSAAASTSGTQTSQKKLDQAAVDKLVADVLGSDQGLAALAQGENVSGAFGTTMKTQLAQDLVTKLVGEIANITAPTVTTTNQAQKQESSTQQSGKKKATVICTELLIQGRFPEELYYHPKALEHFDSLPAETVSGYHAWARKVVPLMQKSPALSSILLPVVLARYLQVIYGHKSILGSLTIYVGQPICYLIGMTQPLFKKEKDHGHAVS